LDVDFSLDDLPPPQTQHHRSEKTFASTHQDHGVGQTLRRALSNRTPRMVASPVSAPSQGEAASRIGAMAGAIFACTEMPMLKIEVEQDEDGRWTAEVPALPGALAYGATGT
jgi:hypothetical protein